MPTWEQMPIALENRRHLITYFDRMQGGVDHASVAGALVGFMRTAGWSYTTTAQSLVNTFANATINCDNLSDLLNYLYAYKNHPNNVDVRVEHVHQMNAPVFLPNAKIQRTGLKIAPNVSGPLPGVFFNSGHRVPSLQGVCYDLISGNQGPKPAMDLAYCRCHKLRTVPVEVYQFNYMGGSLLLTKQPGGTADGLSKYASSYGH